MFLAANENSPFGGGNSFIDPTTGKFTSPLFYSNRQMSSGSREDPRFRRGYRLHGLGDKDKWADAINNIAEAVRGKPKDPLSQLKDIPWQNYLVYGVAAFGAYKLIELVVKRR